MRITVTIQYDLSVEFAIRAMSSYASSKTLVSDREVNYFSEMIKSRQLNNFESRFAARVT